MAILLQSDTAHASLNICCSNTRRRLSTGARAEWACEHVPVAPSSRRNLSTRMLPSAVIYADSKGGGNQRWWGYEVCAGGYTYDGKCDGTYINTSHGARVPIGDVDIERGRTKKHGLQQHTRCMSAGARAEWACVVHVCLLYTSPSPRDLSTSRMPSSA